MAINTFAQNNPSAAVPLPPTTASATTTDVTVTWTADTKGALPTTYLVTGTASNGVTTTATTSGTSVTMFGQNGSRAYTFSVTSQNLSGNSLTSTSTSAVTPPLVYKQGLFARASQTYTIPTGTTYMAAILYGGAGNGGAGVVSGASGKGGGGAGAVAFQNFSVTGGDVYTIVVGAAGGQSSITAPNTTVIASANGGGSGGTGNGANIGGTATSTVAGSATITGGTGGQGITYAQDITGGAGGAQTGGTSFTNLTGYQLNNPISVPALSGGGGGGGAGTTVGYRYGSNDFSSPGGAAGGAGAVAGTNGGNPNPPGNGGAGGGYVAGVLTVGSPGVVSIYVA